MQHVVHSVLMWQCYIYICEDSGIWWHLGMKHAAHGIERCGAVQCDAQATTGTPGLHVSLCPVVAWLWHSSSGKGTAVAVSCAPVFAY